MSTGGNTSIGGISAEVELSTGNLDAQLGAIQGRLDKVAQAIQRWQSQLQAGKITAQQFDSAIDPLIAEQDALRASLERTTQAMAAQATSTTQVSTAMSGISRGTTQVAVGGRNAAMGLLMLSQAVEDAQFGFQAIVNNIPGVVMGFGGSAGIAGAASLAAVGVNQLIKHWDDLKAAFGEGTPHIRTAADEMEELAKSTERTVAQTERLVRLRREQEGMKQVGAGESPAQKETASNVQRIFDEAGGQSIKKLLMDQMMPVMSDDEKIEIERAGRREHVGPSEFGEVNLIDQQTADLQRAIKTAEIQERHRKTAEERALRQMFEATREGPGGDQARAAMAKLPGLAGLPDATAAARRQQDEGAQAAAEQFEMREQMRKQALAEDEERRRLQEESFQEGLGHIGSQGRARVEARRQSRIREAEHAFPGIGDITETLGRTALARNIPMDEVQSRIAAMLEGRGIAGGRERAGVLAKELTRDTERDVSREAVQRELTPRKSQVFDATDLAARIQAGVGGEETPRKQLAELQSIRRTVEELKGKTGLDPKVKQ